MTGMSYGVTDPRSLRAPGYKKTCTKSIMDYLRSCGANPESVPEKEFANCPTRAQFRAVARPLLHQMDLGIDVAIDSDETFDDAYIGVLNALGYPLLSSVKKSELNNINPSGWSRVFGSLVWLYELTIYAEEVEELRRQAEEEAETQADNGEEIDKEVSTKREEKFFFRYASELYKEFLETNNIEGVNNKLRKTFDERGATIDAQLANVEANIIKLSEAIKVEKDKPNPLDNLNEKLSQRLQDKEKSDAIINALGDKIEGLSKAIESGQKELQVKTRQLSTLEAEHDRLSRQVDNQEISVNELARLQREKKEVEIKISAVSEACTKAKQERENMEDIMGNTIREMRNSLMEYGRVLSSMSGCNIDIPDLDLCDSDKMREGLIFVNKKNKTHLDVDLMIKPKLRAFLSTVNSDIMSAEEEQRELLNRRNELEDTTRANETQISELKMTEKRLNTEIFNKQHQLEEDSGVIKREYERTLSTLNTLRSGIQNKKTMQNHLRGEISALKTNMEQLDTTYQREMATLNERCMIICNDIFDADRKINERLSLLRGKSAELLHGLKLNSGGIQ